MDAQTQSQQILAGRLAPIAQMLSSPARVPADLENAGLTLREVADLLREVDADDWADVAAVLSDLVEIAGCSLSETDGAENGRLTDCVARGVSLLSDAIDNPDSMSEELDGFLATVRRDWSDCLAVIDHNSDSRQTESEVDGDVSESPANGTAEVAPSSSEVQLILSSLGSENSPAGESVSRNLFDSSSGETGIIGPPPALSAVDDVALEPELLEAFLYDAVRCLASMEQAVLDFENGGGASAVQQLCRELHTLKGASASVGLENLGSYLHQIEEWLERAGTPSNLDAVLSCVDVIREWVASQQQQSNRDGGLPRPPTEAGRDPAMQSSTPQLSVAGEMATDAEDSLRVKASQIDRLMDLLADLVMLRGRRDRRVAKIGSIYEELLGCVARLQSAASSAGLPSAVSVDSEECAAIEQHSLREGQLSEISGDLSELARALKDLHDPIADENRTISRFIRQFRHELMELRRMPVAGLFRRLQRAVRDASRVEHKQVRLVMVGEHSGLERSLQERLYEPLLHLVRNAVSHGIEAEDERRAAGKSAEGTIALEAMGSAQLLVLEIRDDGRGLDYDAIRRRGVEQGLISADDEPSRSQLSQLIFHPGFSTREQANAVAGRGVGMDVVASVLRRMHARLDIDSEPGRGTTIRLRIPLRSVIEHTMIFRCGGQLFALPVQSVRAASGPDLHDVVDDSTADEPLRLGDVLHLPRQPEDAGGHYLVLGQANLARAGREGAGTRVVVQVDEILGPDEVVVRSVPPLLRRHPLLAGATLSGDGHVVQLLDSDRLAEACLAATDEPQPPIVDETADLAEQLPVSAAKVLVVDDSLSARRSLIQKLRPCGFELHEAGDGFEAVDRLRGGQFDLVFSDLEMPRMGGLDLLAEIRSNRKTRHLPVVIVTTRGEQEFRNRAAELGAHGYLTKPVSAPELEQILDRLDVTSKSGTSKGRNE